MRIRLMGTRAEIDAVLAVLPAVLDVREVSTFYPNRGDSTLGRVYVEVGGVRPATLRASAVRDTTVRADQRAIPPGRPDQITGGG